MVNSRQWKVARTFAAASLFAWLGTVSAAGQQMDAASVIQRVDAAVKARIDHVAAYSVTEHYVVYRGKDETQPAAEMTVRTEYKAETGKNYTILSQSGSEFIRNHVLGTLLDHEKEINLPGIREGSWFTSANYEMRLKSGAVERLDERDCVALTIVPKHKAPNMIEGTLWVDAKDGSIVRIEGSASQSPSIFVGPAQVTRWYVNMNGYSMATHARATSDSFLLGRTIVTIEYRDYQFQLRPAK
jgi:outer membrane lipoprotein-sorting protein